SYFLFSHTAIPLVLITLSMTFLSSSLALTGWRPNLPAAPAAGKTVALNGADRWNDDRKVTTPTFDFSLLGTQPVQVSPLFEHYYSRHSGTSSLGAPLTVAFPAKLGWIQFFRSGALLLPAVQQPSAPSAAEVLEELIETGMKDANTGIIRL